MILQFTEFKLNWMRLVITVTSALTTVAQYRRVYSVFQKTELTTGIVTAGYARLYDTTGFPMSGSRKYNVKFTAQDEVGEWFSDLSRTAGTTVVEGVQGDVFQVHTTVNISLRRPVIVLKSLGTSV